MANAHEIVMALVCQRLRDAIDLSAILDCEAGLEDAIERLPEPRDGALDAAAIIDEAWRRLEAEWREIRALDHDDHQCPLCPPAGLGFEIDLREPAEPVVIDRTVGRTRRAKAQGRG